jgi:hypothetical protein
MIVIYLRLFFKLHLTISPLFKALFNLPQGMCTSLVVIGSALALKSSRLLLELN